MHEMVMDFAPSRFSKDQDPAMLPLLRELIVRHYYLPRLLALEKLMETGDARAIREANIKRRLLILLKKQKTKKMLLQVSQALGRGEGINCKYFSGNFRFRIA